MAAKITRREFIRIAGGTTVITTLSTLFPLGCTHNAVALSAEEAVQISPTVCGICFWKCAGWVYRRGDRPWKVVGNREDLHSHGRLCTRGTGGIGAYLDGDRLKTPLLRVRGKGGDTFQEVSWDEALDYIARKGSAACLCFGLSHPLYVLWQSQ